MAIGTVKRLIEDLKKGAFGEVKSRPPEGSYRVVNLYIDPGKKKLHVEYDTEEGMALQSFELDSNAMAYTPDQLIGLVNSGTSGTGITNLGSGVAKANLDAMAGTARGYVKTLPAAGQYKVIAVQAKNNGKLLVDYDDVAMP